MTTGLVENEVIQRVPDEAPRPRNLEDLQEILQMYNEVTQKLQLSHEKLQSEVVRLTEQLEQKNLELERKKRLAALGEMAAGIAHEIRNPLGGIQLYASTLITDLSDRPAAVELVRKIASGVKGLNGLVSDMLAFTRDLNLRKQDVCLGDLVAATVELAMPSLLAHGIDVRLDAALEKSSACVDAKLLERVLLNLILNAAEAIGDAKAKSGRISVSAKPRDGKIEIIVEDNGPGIPADVIEHIFDPFFTTKHTGTGLGLAIVNRIVEGHGGTIAAENKTAPQHGAIFRIVV